MGPAKPCSVRLSDAEEAMVVELRRRTLLPLDDLLGHLRETLPQLTRSALHRCLSVAGSVRVPLSLLHQHPRLIKEIAHLPVPHVWQPLGRVTKVEFGIRCPRSRCRHS